MDLAEHLVQTVKQAAAAGRPLKVTGAGSKRFWWPGTGGEMLSTVEHTGIVEYEPSELVVTARAGTPLRDLQFELARHGQELAADPPQFAGLGTVGGAVAAGLSGPSRPWRGALRDAVLGVEMINGLGQRLVFGGQVMKNVAGYDVSRLMCGACGTLGVLLSVSLRVQPSAEHSVTLAFELPAQQALDYCRSIARNPLPITGTFAHGERLLVRLSGSEAALRAARESLGGEVSDDDFFWQRVRDHQLDFFKATALERSASSGQLWRISVPPAAALPDVDRQALAIEWGGALRWVWHDDRDTIEAFARQVGGWAWPVGGRYAIDPLQARVMAEVKHAFDPDGLFTSPLQFDGDVRGGARGNE